MDSVSKFVDVKSRQQLAAYLGVPPDDLKNMAYGDTKSYYVSFKIPKKNGGVRRIDAPNSYLKQVQCKLKDEFEALYEPPKSVYGFVATRGVHLNAACHVHKSAVLSLDIRDFFPSVSEKRLYGLFRSAPLCFSEEVAACLARLVCYNKALPQGAPTSPILSNMICLRLDKQLLKYAHERGVFYTRYADDIVMSAKSKRRMASVAWHDERGDVCLHPRLTQIIKKNGFEINSKKVRLAYASSRQVVTGITVNRKCNFPRDEYRSLRVFFHQYEQLGEDIAVSEYVRAHPQYATKLLDDKGEVRCGAVMKHIRGRLDYYTMIDSCNRASSEPLRKLWTMYYRETKRPVPMIDAREALLQAICAYSYTNIGKDEEINSCEGTAFITRDGHLLTCRHCVVPLDALKIHPTAQVEMVFGRTKTSFGVDSFNCDKKLDVAVSSPDMLLAKVPRLDVDYGYLPQVDETVTAYGFAAGRDEVREIRAKVVEICSHGKAVRVLAPFIHGMSGGPVFNGRGKVIGMVTKGSTPDDYSHDGEFVLCSAFKEMMTEGETDGAC